MCGGVGGDVWKRMGGLLKKLPRCVFVCMWPGDDGKYDGALY